MDGRNSKKMKEEETAYPLVVECKRAESDRELKKPAVIRKLRGYQND